MNLFCTMKNNTFSKEIFHAFTLLFFTATFSHAQIERWVYTYDGPANSTDEANMVVFGADSNIYAAGFSIGTNTSTDITVISLTPTGSERWVYRYNGPGNFTDFATSLVYGLDSNIYVAGRSYGNGTGEDFIVISLTTSGNERWVYRYDGLSSQRDFANAICYGLDHNIYAAGATYIINRMLDYLVISLDTAGNERWVDFYNGDADRDDKATSVTYGLEGNIYTAGQITLMFMTSPLPQYYLAKFDTAGTRLWGTTAFDPHHDNIANCIVYGSDNNIHTGGKISFSDNPDFVIGRHDTTFPLVRWIYYLNGSGNAADEAFSITFGLDGNTYAAGYITDSSTRQDFAVISVDSFGERWVYTYSGPSSAADVARSIVYGSDNNIYAAGWCGTSGTGDDIVVIKLNTSGNQQGIYEYNGSADGGDGAYSVVYGLDNFIYAAGFSTESSRDFTVISLDTTTASVEEEKVTTVRNNNLGPTILRGPLVLPKDKTCKVFDITGRVVAPDKIKPGIYFVEVEGQIVQKVVKVR